MDSHTDSPTESPKPYRNRNLYIISIMFIVLWMSCGHISIIVLEFSKLFRKNKDIPIDMVQGCVIVRSQKKAKEVHGMSVIPKELTDEQLAEYFREYVDGCQCKERHTEAARNEVEQYDKMVAYFFPKELKPQNRFYDKMMDVAVEYEESGFMAGYRMCLKHLQEQEQQAQTDTTNSIPEEPKRQEQADTGFVDALDFISSRQIGEMFSAPNGKVVRRIKNQILPYCTDDERREFSLTSERSRQNKYIEVYRLSKKACGIYLDHMEKWSGMINVMTGISEMRKKMQEVFA